MAVGRDGEIQPSTQQELDTPEFPHLMWLASGAGPEKLERLIREVPWEYLVHGVTDGGRVVAFLAFDADSDPVVIRYIAVEEDSQRRGLGGALVSAVTQRTNGRPVYAETADDAVEFYRRTSFQVETKPRDPRWPKRQRYACTLPSTSRPDGSVAERAARRIGRPRGALPRDAARGCSTRGLAAGGMRLNTA